MPAPPEVQIVPDAEALAEAASRRIADALRSAIEARGRATIALSGGQTPVPTYRRLAEADLDWEKLHVFWGDDRCVPPNHTDSNVRLAREALLDHVPIPAAQVYRMEGEAEPDAAAERYEQGLKQFFGGQAPAFDVNVLGVGEDGHTASLFSGSPALKEGRRWVLRTEASSTSPVKNRLTLTFPALNAARLMLVLASGEMKRSVLAEVLRAYDQDPPADDAPPAAHLRPADGRLVWLVTADAAPGDGLGFTLLP